MRRLVYLLFSTLWSGVVAQLHPDVPARYRTLPTLREQATILDGWRDERVVRIPSLLKKHGVDAWLVCQTFATVAIR